MPIWPTSMKQIYFIRHAETNMNRRLYHQGPDEPLSESGRTQVAALIDYLKEQGIDTLISSDYARARETAELVSKALGLPYSIEPSVREFGRPFTLYGHHHLSLASFRYFFDLYRHRLDLLWDKEGAENLAHVRERVRDARLMLEGKEGKRIAVVSHRIFMTMFTETVCYDKPLSLLKFVHGLIGPGRIPNAGILRFACDRSDEAKKCTWFLEETVFPPYTRQANT